MPGDVKSKYSPPVHEAIVAAIRQGNYKSTAARLVGIAPTTLTGWLRSGEADENSRYRQLYLECEQAEAEWESEMLGKVRAAAEKPQNWAAAMTMLERRMPEKYGRRDALTVEGNPDRPITVATHAVLTDPERMEAMLGRFAELAQQTAAALPAGDDVEDGEWDG
jgi:transposase